jgi:hypothetical protein
MSLVATLQAGISMSTHRVSTSSPSTKKPSAVKRSTPPDGGRKKAAARTAPQTKLLRELSVDVEALYERVERLRHRVA